MTATATDTGKGTRHRVGSRVLGVLQRIGRSLMMPIAVLPAAALLLRFGQPDMLGADGLGWTAVAAPLAAAGGAIFDNMPLLFAVGVAIGFARRSDGSTALAAVVGYLVFDRVTRVMFADSSLAPQVTSTIDGTEGVLDLAAANPTGVLGGILIGLTTALLWQRYHRVKLVSWLAFFGGRRFVPILAAVAGLVLGVAVSLAWPPIGDGLNAFGEWITGAGALGAGVYGAVNRALLPLGLHHIVNSLVWFVFGEFEGATGDLNRFFAGDPSAGIFMAGYFPIMMFGLPAAALAIWHTARPERRAAVGGIMVSAALTSFVTGITEPIEYSFLFAAPLLYAIHVVLTGLSLFVATALGITHGFGFSAGAIDYLLNFGIANQPLLLLLIGLGYAAVYYVVFRFLIQWLDLPTPGREPEEPGSEGAPGEQPPGTSAAGTGAVTGETTTATSAKPLGDSQSPA